jgi:hypothetical protein
MFLSQLFFKSDYFISSFRAMPAVMPSGGAQGPSCFDRVKIGFMMGACVGMASGALFGGFSALRYGLRGRELIRQVTEASRRWGFFPHQCAGKLSLMVLAQFFSQISTTTELYIIHSRLST